MVIMGDFNAKVGCTGGKETAKEVLDWANEMRLGERFIEFCDTNELRIRNTCFKKPRNDYIYILGPPQMGSIRIR